MSTTFSFWKKPKLKHKAPMYFSWGFLGVALLLMVGAHQSVGMAPYQTLPYYEQFFKMEIGKISPEEYRNSFNWLMADNYAVAGYVRSEPEATLFIWGTNPVLYALSNKTPASRFTVAFHISEFQAEAETLQRLQSELPTYIIVMKDQSPLEGLSALLQAKYLTFADYDSMKVYRLRARPH